ncbi:MAG: Holliday junction resolvase RuvX [Patescibacteria group bacterium]|nr:Holliday junction resolvase RuvX [Patescibacteria group bacterium]
MALKKFLGIDWGEKRIGLAAGDSQTKMAVPYKVVAELESVLEIIRSDGINKIVIGQPITKSGDDSNLRAEFQVFVKKIKAKINTPVELVDERLTSKAADALIGSKKTKAPRDAIAAMLILQAYFDKLN